MNRREAVLSTAGLIGITLSSSLLSALLQGCQHESKPADFKTEKIITQLHKKIIAEVAELIIPTTKTPGAKAAKVPEFISMMITDCYKPEDQIRFIAGIRHLNDASNSKFSKPFLDCDPVDQTQLLVDLEKEARKIHKNDKKSPLPFILMIKELTLVGSFTSKIGSTLALNYIQIPGRYDGCVPLNQDQKAWAT